MPDVWREKWESSQSHPIERRKRNITSDFRVIVQSRRRGYREKRETKGSSWALVDESQSMIFVCFSCFVPVEAGSRGSCCVSSLWLQRVQLMWGYAWSHAGSAPRGCGLLQGCTAGPGQCSQALPTVHLWLHEIMDFQTAQDKDGQYTAVLKSGYC